MNTTRHGLLAAALLLGSLLAPAALGAHASAARHLAAPRALAAAPVGAVLPWPDLAVAAGARHLRFLSLEEPGAAFADGPASLDADPAGGCLAPPRQVWAEEGQP